MAAGGAEWQRGRKHGTEGTKSNPHAVGSVAHKDYEDGHADGVKERKGREKFRSLQNTEEEKGRDKETIRKAKAMRASVGNTGKPEAAYGHGKYLGSQGKPAEPHKYSDKDAKESHLMGHADGTKLKNSAFQRGSAKAQNHIANKMAAVGVRNSFESEHPEKAKAEAEGIRKHTEAREAAFSAGYNHGRHGTDTSSDHTAHKSDYEHGQREGAKSRK